MNPQVTTVKDRVTKATTVITSATALINGFQSLLDEAVAKAIENGATETELVPLTDLSAAMEAETDSLAAAVLANTKAPA